MRILTVTETRLFKVVSTKCILRSVYISASLLSVPVLAQEHQIQQVALQTTDIDVVSTGSTKGAVNQQVLSNVESSLVQPDSTSVQNRRYERLSPVGGIDQGTVIEEADPNVAEGIRVGSFVFRPSIEIGLNASHSKTQGDVFGNENVMQLLANSDWSRHALDAEINGTLPVDFSGNGDGPTYDANASLRLDVSSVTTFTLGASLSAQNETPRATAFIEAVDPALNSTVFVDEDAIVERYGGSAALNHDFGLVFANLRGSVEKTNYGSGRLSDGRVFSQSELDSLDVDVNLRTGLSLSAALSPFLEAGYGERRMDQTVDDAGINRDVSRYSLRLGTLIDFGEKLNGDIAVGYAHEAAQDDRLSDADGFIIAAGLNWSPVRGTDVSLTASTDFQPTGARDVSSALVYASELVLSQRFVSNLTGTLSFSGAYEHVDGTGSDTLTLNGQVGFLYNINRYMGLTGRIGHEQAFSDVVGGDDNTTNVFVGLRLQK